MTTKATTANGSSKKDAKFLALIDKDLAGIKEHSMKPEGHETSGLIGHSGEVNCQQ